MGRAKHCSVETRKTIKKLIFEGNTYAQVGRIIGCSNKMICNALKYDTKPETRGRKLAMTPKMVTRLVRESKKDPFKPASELKKDLNISAAITTVRSCLRDNKLYARSPRKVPLLTKKNIAKRIKFANQYVNWSQEKWRNILWSDESKIVLFGGKGSRSYVRRPPNTEYNPRFTCKTIKHGGSSIMVWGCFSYYGVGPIHWIRPIMDQNVYVDILETVMLPYAEYKMPLLWVFQQDNDPKHTSRKARSWFETNRVNVLEWPAQSPDLNPIENLWSDVKKDVSKAKPKNNMDLWATVQVSWKNIPKERCQGLVDSMPRRCAAVLAAKGFTTKY